MAEEWDGQEEAAPGQAITPQVGLAVEGRPRRPNVVVNEKQIANDPPGVRTTQNNGLEASTSVRRAGGSGPRRAAEEDEHMVVRGKQGGMVIQASRVFSGGETGDVPSPVWQPTKEHHSDPRRLWMRKVMRSWNLMECQRMRMKWGPTPLTECLLLAVFRLFGFSLVFLSLCFFSFILWICYSGTAKGRVDGLSTAPLNTFSRNISPIFWASLSQKCLATRLTRFARSLGSRTGFVLKPLVLAMVTQFGYPPWVFAPVYGSPTHHLRRRLWRELSQSKRGVSGSWLVAGDFNSVTSKEETSNYISFSTQRSSDFVTWIQDECLIDLGFSGPKLTWVKDGSTAAYKGARLDRALCNLDWRIRFPEASVVHLPRIASDHAPLLVRLQGGRQHSHNKHFLFQAAWLTHEDLGKTVQRLWSADQNLLANVEQVATGLSAWNREVFGNIHKRKKIIMSRLSGIQKVLAENMHRGLFKLEQKLRLELEEILYQEELMWFQKSREEWITSGDRNTAYYHAAATVRRGRNRVARLQDSNGAWITTDSELRKHIQQFYINLFTDCREGAEGQPLEAHFPRLRHIDWAVFNREVTKEEVHEAVCDMKPFKAPGPDGLPAGFYQHTWDVTGDNIFAMVSQAFRHGQIPEGINDTLVALIPKVQVPDTIKQFRPISLCNVSYKILTKTITNRLKSILPRMVVPFQSSFVPGRQISDNVIMYQEILHTMRESRGNKKYMAIKLDLEKAYDRLSWDFIKDTLEHAGFNERWRDIIMTCITTPRLAIIWNGDRLEPFRPERGIRQGDAMSPAIFVLCMERLSQLITAEVDSLRWKGIKLAASGPTMSHLCFADDMVLFTEATSDQVEIVQNCLAVFCAASEQKVSLDKSQIYFSKNMAPALGTGIASKFGISETKDLGRYLGVPSIHGRVTCHTYDGLLERIATRLEGWKAKTLSLAGRVTLAKSVLNAIPVYTMQTAALPKGICEEIEKRTRRFIWGKNEHIGGDKMSLASWDLVTKPKEAGGLGLHRLHDMNIACMVKLGWRLRTNSNSLWAQVIMSKYGSLEHAAGRRKRSNVWKGITMAKEVLDNGITHLVRDGSATQFWMDKWITPRPLYDQLQIPLGLPDLYATVSAYWDQDRGWKWEKLADTLPQETLERIAGYRLTEEGISDEWGWGPGHRGHFSVKSAYDFITNSPVDAADTDWKRLWALRVPARVSMFLWLVKHGRILTNAERARRHLTSNDFCFRCAGKREDMDHIFRECPAARQIWSLSLHTQMVEKLRTLSWQEWFTVNLHGAATHGFDDGWPERFGNRLWWLWHWRNDEVFNHHHISVEQKIDWLRRYDAEVAGAFAKKRRPLNRKPMTVETSVASRKPPSDWVKINVDGSCRRNKIASCGGALRNDRGDWLCGFTYKIGRCSIEVAEAWGVLHGLCMARHWGATKIILECDSKSTIESLRRKKDWHGQVDNIGRLCLSMATQFSEVRFEHIYREQNQLADSLATMVNEDQQGLQIFEEPPPMLASVIEMDKIGASLTRRVLQVPQSDV
ncbi:PREDICTED: uncharacterized protein LOC109193865 [Ipomoea nil]|uniref:uncharacterized protein LOC109193865 n=1 Tax=Ipomoea nil TaxID=35883 RepID=UPI000901646F|nr:PREDICTED: uncharacterized protein LOC109193865 [Ipomoea nil]